MPHLGPAHGERQSCIRLSGKHLDDSSQLTTCSAVLSCTHEST